MSAVTYNDWVNTRYMYFYDLSATTFTSRNITTGDYFTDTCAVGDCLYISDISVTGVPPTPFRNIQFYIGTAFAATSVTFVWEYHVSGSTWATLPDLVDNTSDFSLTGQRTVEWTVPSDWTMQGTPSPSVNYPFWVRCRITAINTPTEGGAQSTNPVQVGNHAILVSGYTLGTPCTLATIYTAEVAGSWGMVTKGSDYQYRIGCNFMFDSTTPSYFAELDKMIEVYGVFCVGNNGNCRLGETTSGYITRNGCMLFLSNPVHTYYLFYATPSVTNKLELYNSTISSFKGCNAEFSAETVYIFNCIFDGLGQIQFINAVTATIFNLTLNVYYITRGFSLGAIVNDVKMLNCSSVIYSAGLMAYEPVIRGLYTEGTKLMQVWTANIIHLVNCTLENRTVSWTGSSVDSHRIYLEYSLALKVQDSSAAAIQGASVAITDVNGDAVTGSPFTTDANGDITSQDLLQYEVKHKVGSGTGSGSAYTDETLYTPHTITISKSGYQTKTMVLDMDKKREEVETLEKAVKFITAGGDPLLWNLKATDGQNKHNWIKA